MRYTQTYEKLYGYLGGSIKNVKSKRLCFDFNGYRVCWDLFHFQNNTFLKVSGE